MTDKTRPPLRPPLRTRDLSAQQRSLMGIMRKCKFGRVENMSFRAGQPILDRDLKVVRVARLGGESSSANVAMADEFELKQAVRDLFAEMARLQNGTVVRLEFKHGLPFLLEIAETTEPASSLGAP